VGEVFGGERNEETGRVYLRREMDLDRGGVWVVVCCLKQFRIT
jgi:hypothetical protein